MSDVRFPCLSIRQPWVDMILWGAKDVENRPKVTHFRGTILIHASAGRIGASAEDMAIIELAAKKAGVISQNVRYEPERGVVLGMVEIVDCVTKSKSEDFHGPYGWLLANPVRFRRAIPFKGNVGIFYVPRALLAGTPAARKKSGQSRSK